MFTGLVQAVGSIISFEGKDLWIDRSDLAETDFEAGESIAVNGCCLTLVEQSGSKVKFQLSEETIQKTSFEYLPAGSQVNLERALAVGQRLGGHWVQGHVDAVGKVTLITPLEGWTNFSFEVPRTPYVIEKGSICLDGISLTIVDLRQNEDMSQFNVAVIPHTLKNTNLGNLAVGALVNVEFDLVAKYIQAGLTSR